MVALAISAELEEDSVLPIVPVIRDDMAKAFALAEENVFINGNTTHAATVTDPASATSADWYITHANVKLTRIAGNSLEPKYHNVIPFRNKHEGLKNLGLDNQQPSPKGKVQRLCTRDVALMVA